MSAATIERRRLSGMFVTVGAGGRVWPGPDPATSFEVVDLAELVDRSADHGAWRVVWLTAPALPHFGLDADRRDPLPLNGRMRARCASWEPGSPFAGVHDPQALFHSLWNLEEALGGTGWHTSGAITSDVLLRAIHSPPHGRPIARTTMPAVGLKGPKGQEPAGGELPIMWHRQPTAAADRGGWVHHYDLNGAYLAAASKLRLPQGEPVRLGPDFKAPRPAPNGIPGPGAAHRTYPGYWRVELGAWGIEVLPAPIGHRRARRGGDVPLWATSPTLRYLDEIGEPYRVIDGWYWLSYCEALTRWYEILRDARSSLEGPERRAVSAIYQQGIGRLMSLHENTLPLEGTAVGGEKRRAQANDPLEQPAWAHHVIAESRSRIHRRLMCLSRAPLAVENDSLWVQCDDPDPAGAARELRLPLGPGLGEWKHLGTLRAIDAADIFAGPAARVLAELRRQESGRVSPDA